MILLNPEVARRSCHDCRKYLYHDRGPGEFGQRCERQGKPVLRPRGSRTPCAWCPKIPPGLPPSPDHAEDLSEKNYQAYAHYLGCKATGDFPADPIVRRNAAIIRAAEDVADRLDQQRYGLTVLNTMMRGR